MLDEAGEEMLYLAGEVAPSGEYVRVDAWPRAPVVLTRDGRLPASFDGRVAAYHRLPPAPRAQPRSTRTRRSRTYLLPRCLDRGSPDPVPRLPACVVDASPEIRTNP